MENVITKRDLKAILIVGASVGMGAVAVFLGAYFTKPDIGVGGAILMVAGALFSILCIYDRIHNPQAYRRVRTEKARTGLSTAR